MTEQQMTEALDRIRDHVVVQNQRLSVMQQEKEVLARALVVQQEEIERLRTELADRDHEIETLLEQR